LYLLYERSPGDGALFYFTAPDSSVWLRGTILGRPWKDEDPGSEWEGKYFAEVGELEVLAYPVARRGVLLDNPSWEFWRRPQTAVRVRDEYLGWAWRLFDAPTLSSMRAEVEAAGESLLRPVVMNYQTKRMRREAARGLELVRRESAWGIARRAGVSEACVAASAHAAALELGVVIDEALDGLRAWQDSLAAAEYFRRLGALGGRARGGRLPGACP
jgi:hypothetical protein